MPRYPGMKHSGKQMILAPSTEACAMACSANATDSSGSCGVAEIGNARCGTGSSEYSLAEVSGVGLPLAQR